MRLRLCLMCFFVLDNEQLLTGDTPKIVDAIFIGIAQQGTTSFMKHGKTKNFVNTFIVNILFILKNHLCISF